MILTPYTILVAQVDDSGSQINEVHISGSNLTLQTDNTGLLIGSTVSGISSSYALSASYTPNSDTASYYNGNIINNQLPIEINILGVTASFLGNLIGTSSLSNNSINSISASYVPNLYPVTSVPTASFSSASISSSYATTAGISISFTSSILNNQLPNQINVTGITASFSGSMLGTSSWSNNSSTSSYINASGVNGTILSASYSISSSYSSTQLPDITDNTSIHYIGVNQPNPQYQLDVNGIIGNSHNSTWLALGGNKTLSIGDVLNVSNDATLNTDGTNFWFSPSGIRVGVGGITAPVNTLDVVGNISCSVLTASLLYGTASLSNNSLTASYVSSGNVVGTVTSASYSLSASYVPNLYPVINVPTASFASSSISSSYSTLAGTATIYNGNIINSQLPTQINVIGITASFTGSLLGTSSWSSNSLTASYILASNIVGTVNSASYSLSSSYTINTLSASHALISDSASYIDASGINTGTLNNLRLPSQINVTGITSSQYGTSSWSNNSLTSSYMNAGGIFGTVNSASYSLSSSYSIVAGTANLFNGNITNGQLPSQINVTGITASHLGTSSWSSNSISASYAPVTLISGNTYTITSSWSNNSLTSSYLIGSVTSASYALNSTTASVYIGNIINGQLPSQISVTGITASFTGSLVGSLTGTSSWSNNSLTSSYLIGSITSASYALSSSYSTTAGTASNFLGAITNGQLPSQINITGITASVVGTSSWSSNSLTASYVSSANIIGTVTSASYSLSASYAPTILITGNTYPITSSWSNNTISSSYIDGGNIGTGTINNSRLPSQINVTGVTASLLGTSSWSSNSISSSYIDAGNISTGTLSNSRLPSQINVTGITSSHFGTSSWSNNSISSSYLSGGAVVPFINVSPILIPTGSFVNSAAAIFNITSSVGSGSNIFGNINVLVATGSAYGLVIAASGSVTSYAISASNGSIIANGFSGSLLGTASLSTNSVTASYGVSSSYSTNAFSASYAPTILITGNTYTVTSSWANNSISTSYIDAGNISTGTLNNSRLPSQINVTGVTASFVGNLTGTSSWSSNSINSTSASYVSAGNVVGTVSSASYSLNSTTAAIYNGNIINGQLPSQINITGITASLVGTSSWSSNCLTSNTASYVLASNITGTVTSASYSISSSYASIAGTANNFNGNITNGQLPSQINVTGITASLLGTSSWSTNSINSTSASYAPAILITGNTYNITSSWSNNSLTASYLNGFITSASYALTASYASNGGSGGTNLTTGSTYPITSSWSNYSITSSYVTGSNALVTTYSGSYVSLTGNKYNSFESYQSFEGYTEFNIINTTSSVSASSDLIATNNSGSSTTYYIDVGINGTNYNQGFIGSNNDSYVYNTGSNLYIGTITPNTSLYLFAGGYINTSSVVLTSTGKFGIGLINPANSLDVIGNISCSTITASMFGTSSYANTSSFLRLFNQQTGKWYAIIISGSLGNETLQISGSM